MILQTWFDSMLEVLRPSIRRFLGTVDGAFAASRHSAVPRRRARRRRLVFFHGPVMCDGCREVARKTPSGWWLFMYEDFGGFYHDFECFLLENPDKNDGSCKQTPTTYWERYARQDANRNEEKET